MPKSTVDNAHDRMNVARGEFKLSESNATAAQLKVMTDGLNAASRVIETHKCGDDAMLTRSTIGKAMMSTNWLATPTVSKDERDGIREVLNHADLICRVELEDKKGKKP